MKLSITYNLGKKDLLLKKPLNQFHGVYTDI